MNSLVFRKGLNKKRTVSKFLSHRDSRKSFCLKANLIENEILKSFTSFSDKFKINSKKSSQPVYPNDQSVSISSMKQKYFDEAQEKNIDQLIKSIFQEEVLNLKQEREFENLLLFIKNCKKYNYDTYLQSPKYFQNKEIRQFMLNTSLLETIHQKSSPFSLQAEFEVKLKVQSLYNLRKGEKDEKVDSITEKEFEIDYYKYLNFLAETSEFENLAKKREIKAHNEKVMKEFQKGDDLLDKDEESHIRDEVWRNHYIEYLKKMKKSERKESLGLSKYEESLYNENLEKNAEEIFESTNRSYIRDDNDKDFLNFKEEMKNEERARANKNQEKAPGEEVNRFQGTQFETFASFINDGSSEPYPFYGKDDYPIEEFFDETKNAPDKNLIFAPLKEEEIPNPIPPKMNPWLDRMLIDAHFWSLFTYVQHQRLFVNKMNELTFNFFNELKAYHIKSFNDFFDNELPPSLLDYYNLLPKWARDHPAVKMVVRGLEFHQPWTSYREKLMAVNWTLQILIEKDRHYNELINLMANNRREDITSENLPSLLEHDEEEQRNIIHEDIDEATDDEELELVGTAEEVRAIEREEEEARKKKKKEEGRAKREAEEQKALAAEGKIDKAAEDKKKKEAEEKKKKEAEAAEAEAAEEEPEEAEEETQSDASKNDEKELEDRMFAPTSKSKFSIDKEEEVLNIYDGINERMRGEKKDDIDENLDEDERAVGEIDQEMINSLRDQFKATFNKEEDNLSFDGEIEELRKMTRESKVVMENKKEKLSSVLRDLKMTPNLATFEEKVKFLKKNLEEVSDKLEVLANLSDSKDKNTEILIYPLSLLNSNELSEEQKAIIIKHFKAYVNLFDEERKKKFIVDLDVKKDGSEAMMSQEDLLSRIATFENENKDSSEGFDLQSDLKDTLKDDEVTVEVTDETSLTDAYYKHDPELDFRERVEDPIPFDYYINDDGFWDGYIALQRSKINVRNFTYKPFNPYMKNIKKHLL